MAWQVNRLGILAAMALATMPALAQAPDRAATPPPPPAQNVRINSYTLRNMATKPITSATANMTNGQVADITAKGRIMPNQSQSFGANNAGCIDKLSVTFSDGTMLPDHKIEDCGKASIVVRDNDISSTSSATAPNAEPNSPSNNAQTNR